MGSAVTPRWKEDDAFRAALKRLHFDILMSNVEEQLATAVERFLFDTNEMSAEMLCKLTHEAGCDCLE